MSHPSGNAAPSLPADAHPAHPPAGRASFFLARFWLVMSGVITASILITVQFGRMLDHTLPKAALPVLSPPYPDLIVTERSGRTVHLDSLRGQVVVLACIYTVCPHGCAAVVGQMQKLHADFGSRPGFHLVSLAVAPERDTPAFLSSYADGLGLKAADPWWFVTGDQPAIWDFMTGGLKLHPPKPIPEDERINPLDLYAHDLRIVLADRAGRVRGYYDVFHPQPEIAALMAARLHRDVGTLLAEPPL